MRWLYWLNLFHKDIVLLLPLLIIHALSFIFVMSIFISDKITYFPSNLYCNLYFSFALSSSYSLFNFSRMAVSISLSYFYDLKYNCLYIPTLIYVLAVIQLIIKFFLLWHKLFRLFIWVIWFLRFLHKSFQFPFSSFLLQLFSFIILLPINPLMHRDLILDFWYYYKSWLNNYINYNNSL